MNLTFSRPSGHKSGYLTDQPHDNPCEDDYDGKSVEVDKITFGCNQRCPTVGLSPTYQRLGTKRGPAEAANLTASSSTFDFVPHLHHFPVGIGPHFKEKITQMFRSKSQRAQKQWVFTSKSQSTANTQTPATQSKPIASSAFDEMLRSNQTLYIGGVNDIPVSYQSREVLYSNIPLTSSKASRPSR